MKVETIMRIRGAAKVALLTILTNEVLTITFAAIARRIAPDISLGMIQLISLSSALLVGFWFQADARRAFLRAQQDGYIVVRRIPEPVVVVRDNCPKRWLVQLYLELNPAMVRH